MSHVTKFMTSYSDIDDLAEISAMSQLRKLHIGATQTNDLSGLRSFPNLTLLHVQYVKNVADFSPVGRMTGLQELAIGSNELGDMASLTGLRNLKGAGPGHHQFARRDFGANDNPQPSRDHVQR